MPTVMEGRIARKRYFFEHRKLFIAKLFEEIVFLRQKAKSRGLKTAVRLNGTSDIAWEKVAPSLFTINRVQFYDYTKSVDRASKTFRRGWPKNYKLILSRSEENTDACLKHLSKGGNVAVVFPTKRKERLPSSWLGYSVIDGDRDDAWFARIKSGQVLGLRAKGKATSDKTGFVYV